MRAEDFSDEIVEAIRASEMTATEILPDTVTIDRALAIQVLKLVRPFALPSEYSELPLAVRLAQAAEAFERASPEYGGGIYREVLDEHYSGD